MIRICGHKNKCTICGQIVEYEDYGWDVPLFREKRVVGGGHRERVMCPKCGCNDRIRWVDYVIKHFTDIYYGENTILHIAPEPGVREKILKNRKANYMTGDIERGVADYVVNVEDMPFENEKFDYIILNHVMEHVINEAKAVYELKRCLKHDGTIIFSVPISLDEDTFEDPTIMTEEARFKAYGQGDHVRLYGKDIIDRFNKYDLCLKEYNVSQLLSQRKIEKYRLMPNDRLYFARKAKLHE